MTDLCANKRRMRIKESRRMRLTLSRNLETSQYMRERFRIKVVLRKLYCYFLCREIKLYTRKLYLDNFIFLYDSIFCVIFQELYFHKYHIILVLYKIFFNIIRE